MLLRWLIIERARYFRNPGVLRQPSWYAYVHASDGEHEAGKLFSLEELGINCLRADGHAAIRRNLDGAA